MPEKVSKRSVAYQDTPKDGKRCSGCTMFVDRKGFPSGCSLVLGVISPRGYCLQYEAKK